MTDTYIEDTDSGIALISRVAYNGATATTDKIILQVTGINYDVGTYTQTAEQPARGVSTLPGQISYGDWLGFSNPKIKINGIIDLTEYTTGTIPLTAPTGYTYVTLKLLQQIFKSGHTFTLTDEYATGIYRIHSLDATDVVTTIKVMCKGMSIDSAAQGNEGRINYSIDFVEVK